MADQIDPQLAAEAHTYTAEQVAEARTYNAELLYRQYIAEQCLRHVKQAVRPDHGQPRLREDRYAEVSHMWHIWLTDEYVSEETIKARATQVINKIAQWMWEHAAGHRYQQYFCSLIYHVIINIEDWHRGDAASIVNSWHPNKVLRDGNRKIDEMVGSEDLRDIRFWRDTLRSLTRAMARIYTWNPPYRD